MAQLARHRAAGRAVEIDAFPGGIGDIFERGVERVAIAEIVEKGAFGADRFGRPIGAYGAMILAPRGAVEIGGEARSEEHTSELQSLMRISYAVFCLKKKKQPTPLNKTVTYTTQTKCKQHQ